MANDIKKKKKNNGKPSFILGGVILVALFVAIYTFVTWPRPSHNPADLIGRWLYDKSGVAIVTETGYATPSSVIYEFRKDGTVALINAVTNQTAEGTYTASENMLTFDFDGNTESFEFVVKGKTLTLGPKDDSLTLKKLD